MRGIYQISTGKLIQATDSSSDETLTRNAVNAGFSPDDLEFRDIPDLEAELNRLNPPPNPRRIEILLELEKIDKKSIRALREGDSVRINNYEAQAQALRTELAAVQA